MFTYIRVILAIIIALLLATHGYRKRSLSISGSIAAIVVGFIAFSGSLRFGFILIVFYYTSSRVTKIKEDIKAKLEMDYQIGGQRSYIQVLSCSLLASIVVIVYYIKIGEDTDDMCVGREDCLSLQLWGMYIAHYACANGDTWASELGILSKVPPRLITSLWLRQVPPGTNGGMSLGGTLASAAGGAAIGLLHFLLTHLHHVVAGTSVACPQYPVLAFGALAGLIGSLIDSLLGATCQATYYSKERKAIVRDPRSVPPEDLDHICGLDILSNEAVNAISIALTMVCMIPFSPLLFYAV